MIFLATTSSRMLLVSDCGDYSLKWLRSRSDGWWVSARHLGNSIGVFRSSEESKGVEEAQHCCRNHLRGLQRRGLVS